MPSPYPLPDNSFDTVIGSFVFCSVPLPVKGLKELYRVCKPGGQVLLLEHVLSSKTVIAKIMNFYQPCNCCAGRCQYQPEHG